MKSRNISINHEIFNFLELCKDKDHAVNKEDRLDFYTSKSLSQKTQVVLEDFLNTDIETRSLTLKLFGLEYKKLEYDENCKKHLYEYELFEIFMNNPFYLYTLPIDKIINLLEYSLFIYKIMLIQQTNDIAKVLLGHDTTIGVTFMQETKINLASNNIFRLEPFNKDFTENMQNDYKQKMSQIVGAHLKSFMATMTNHFNNKILVELTILNKYYNSK